MAVWEWIRFLIGGGLLLAGLVTFVIEMIGVFRFRYVLNRMHAAAIGDTLGISFSLIGLMVFNGLNFTTMKLALLVIFFWVASPISSHMLARLEVTTNTSLKQHCDVYEDLSVLEKELSQRQKQEELQGKEAGEP